MRRTRKDPVNVAREKTVPQTPNILIPAQSMVAPAFVIRILDQRRVRDRAIP